MVRTAHWRHLNRYTDCSIRPQNANWLFPTVSFCHSLAAIALLMGSIGAKANLWQQWRGRDFTSIESRPSDIADFARRLSFTLPEASPDQKGLLPEIHLRDENLTLTASEDSVFDFRNLRLVGGTLTLEATAGTSITINVSNRFSLANGAEIVLSGGLQPTDVTFNVIGGGPTVRIRRGSTLTGVLNAGARTVRIGSDSIVNGVVNAEHIVLASGGDIVLPPVVSP